MAKPEPVKQIKKTPIVAWIRAVAEADAAAPGGRSDQQVKQ